MHEEYWDRLADTKSFNHPVNVALLDTILDRDALIVEIGCGYGRVLAELKANGFHRLLGLDSSEGMIVRARRDHPGN